MRALFLALAVGAAAFGATSAQPTYAQPTMQVPIPQQRLVLDAAHTQVAFSANRFGFNNTLGRFDTIAGEVVLDQTFPERSSVNATIQVASLSSGNATRDEHLKGANWLNAAEFPTMTFRSTRVTRTGDQTADVTGEMTIKGVTQPVTLHVTLNRVGASPSNNRQVAGFSATATISRTAFGVGRAPTTLIADEVTITIEALGEAPAA
jgi:polyisoprenoid-binding protein YceI